MDSLSFFGDKSVFPEDELLSQILGTGLVLKNELCDFVAEFCGNKSEEWKYYSKKAGWSLVVKSGGRTIFYLIPQEGFFKVSFVFGEKATARILASALPEHLRKSLMESHTYAEGRSLMLDIKNKEDSAVISELIKIKHLG